MILYASQGIVTSLFEIIKELRSGYKKYVWIGSDAWSGRTVKSSVQDVAVNALTVQPEVRTVPAFDEYFQRYSSYELNCHSDHITYYQNFRNAKICVKLGMSKALLVRMHIFIYM